MSYIRPLSNPESLYIIGTDKGIEFCGSDLPSIPYHVFYGLILKLNGNYCGKGSYRGLKIEEKEFYKETITIPAISKKKSKEYEKQFGTKYTDEMRKEKKIDLNDYKFVLTYKGVEYARMFGVTWAYIFRNVERDAERDVKDWKKKKAKVAREWKIRSDKFWKKYNRKKTKSNVSS